MANKKIRIAKAIPNTVHIDTAAAKIVESAIQVLKLGPIPPTERSLQSFVRLTNTKILTEQFRNAYTQAFDGNIIRPRLKAVDFDEVDLQWCKRRNQTLI